MTFTINTSGQLIAADRCTQRALLIKLTAQRIRRNMAVRKTLTCITK